MGSPPSPPAAIILAAGLSSRMGRFKPLIPLGSKPLIQHVIDAFAGLAAPRIIVTGHHAPDIQKALSSQDLILVHNPHFASGEMLSSLHVGIHALPLATRCFFLAFADQPAVSPKTLSHLAQAWAAAALTPTPHPQPPLLAIPAFNNRHGHPILLSTSLIPEILDLPPHKTLKKVVHRHRDQTIFVPVNDSAILEDLDTPEDLTKLQNRLQSP